MKNTILITIENKLILEKRDINVYHHDTKSAHIISYDSSIPLPLRPATDNDYLHVSIVSGPGRLEGKCILLLPTWINFELSTTGNISVVHSDKKIFLKVPPGPPDWQLKITRSGVEKRETSSDNITVGDSHLEYQ
jgi:hypothetical protein